MFDFVRNHNRVMQILLFILIVPSFVLFGLEGYNRYREGGETVAKVDGREISRTDWDNAHKQAVDRLREQMPNLDAKLFDSPEARYGTLERLVQDHVLAAAVEHNHLLVGDQRVARELQNNELIAALRGADGKLDMQRYRDVLKRQGMTPEMFENNVRNDLARGQVLNGVLQTAFMPKAQAGVALDSYFERREAQVAHFNAADFRGKVAPTDAELQAFYKENPQLFQAPEQANIEYVVLDPAAVSKDVTVNEADLKTYYEQNASRLGGKDERRASHILIAVPKGAPQADKDKARAKAEAVLAQVKKNPAGFADIAKKESQDPGSAAQGGDLDFFGRGAMVKPVEDVVFGMKTKGEISGLVESEFGYHIVQLTDMKSEKPPTFEEMRPKLEEQVRREQAQKKFSESAETFSNTVYEQPDSLKPVAEKLKLEVRTAQAVTRTPQAGVKGPLANPKFLQSLFSSDALERKRNTEAVEFGPSQLVAGRITQYSPAHARPFEEVKDQVRDRVVATKAAELAKKEGEAKLAAWKANPAGAQLPAAVVLSRQAADKQSPKVVEAALRADPSKLPALAGVDLGLEGYSIVKVNRVLPREAPAAQQAQQELLQYARAWTTAEAEAYYNLLKDRFNVQIKVPKPKEGATR
ncbi:MAG TPA: SurA N-terminal domain-containing protein [Ramlibacter sp.]|uniref:SurA N-terminal domain-containing protein n=1 Tax=Ramlibacter sp. TaxID=1917967 RepID=UPI002ED338D3